MLTTQQVRDVLEDALLELQYQDVVVQGLSDDTILCRWKENEDEPDEAALQIVINPHDYPYGVDLDEFEPGEIPERESKLSDEDRAELQSQIKGIEADAGKRIEELESETKEKDSKIDAIDEDLKTASARVEDLEGQLKESQGELEKAQKEAEKAGKKAK